MKYLALLAAALLAGSGLLSPVHAQQSDTLPSVSGLGRVHAWGTGSTPVVVVSGVSAEGVAFRPLAETLGAEFTVYGVTLPGIGTTEPMTPANESPLYPAWWSRVTEGVRALVAREALDQPWIVGELESGLVVLQALADPQSPFAGGVVINTGVSANMLLQAPLDPVAVRPLEARRQAIDSVSAGFSSGDLRERERAGRVWAQTLVRTNGLQAALSSAMARTDPGVRRRYRQELFGADVDALAGRRSRPLLALVSIPDAASALAGAGAESVVAGWVDAASSGQPPLRVEVLEATRQMASVDAPERVAEALRAFMDQPDAPDAPPPLPSSLAPSPPRETSALIGATQVAVRYSSPARRGRPVWGALVPFGRPWRAGANASTAVSFDRAVRFGGQDVPAGQYSLYVIPHQEGAWDVLLHRRSPDFGTYTFFYDDAGEVARVRAAPTPVDEVEYLSYHVTPTGLDRGNITLAWDTLALTVPVEASEGLGDAPEMVAPDALANLSWSLVAEDGQPTGGGAPAAESLEVAPDPTRDLIWFRIHQEQALPLDRLGVNLAFDLDRDFSTGATWWGANREFAYDRVFTLWVVRSSSGYRGRVGWSDQHAFAGLFPTNLRTGELFLSVDEAAGTVAVGLPRSSLTPLGPVRMLAAVGTDVGWNDDLPDAGGVELDLRSLWERER